MKKLLFVIYEHVQFQRFEMVSSPPISPLQNIISAVSLSLSISCGN